MKLSFSTLACPEWDFKKIIDRAKEYGYDGIEIRGVLKELDLAKVPELNEYAENTKEILNKYNLEISCIASSCIFTNPDPKERKKNIEMGISHIEIAKRFNCNVVRVFVGRLPKDIEFEKVIDYAAESIREVVEYAEKKQVKIGIETHDDFCKGERLNLFFQRIKSEYFGCVWDVYNSLYEGDKLTETFEFIKDKIFHLHIKDGDFDRGYKLLGEGKLPIKEIIDLLKKINYKGYLSFEYEKRWHTNLLPPEVSLPHYVEFMRKLI
ncbi:MAG: sugar phosphate isomerase/epimerase [Candidatus Omnitrophica bacterium]|nr:sugar phosphate isomerase/epimerase [Candidatus Omnitrophota bacterium]